MTSLVRSRRSATGHRPVVVPYADLPRMRVRRATRGGTPGGDLTAPRLTMHTIQTREAWRVLVETGVLRCDRSPVEREFRLAYAWLDDQMTAQGLPGDGMLWLYARASHRSLRWHAALNPGAVLLTVEVPEDRALLHHHGDWPAVLNNGPLLDTRPDEPWPEFARRWDAVDASGPAAVRATWQSIFDRSWWEPNSEIQATVREIRAEDVTRAVVLRRSRFSSPTS